MALMVVVACDTALFSVLPGMSTPSVYAAVAVAVEDGAAYHPPLN
jgi:hypothetical protein